MNLRKLLIGSTAVLFAGGVASTAQAADPAGLVVTSMAEYVEQCNNGNGWTKNDWCITLSGAVVWGTTYGSTIEYGLNPGDAELEGPEWDGFALRTGNTGTRALLTATRATDMGNLTIRIPLYGTTTGTPDLTIGAWRFNSNGVRYQQSFGPAQLTVTVQNPGTLGWTEQRDSDFEDETQLFGPDGPDPDNDDDPIADGDGLEGIDFNEGPWPDIQIEVGFDAGFADLDFGVNFGQRSTTYYPGGPDPVDPTTEFWTIGGYAQADAELGFGDLLVRFDFDRVNAANDGTANPVWAYGVRADLDVELGAFTLTPAIGWSRNYGYYGFKYDEHELGNYFFAELGAEFAVNDEITLAATAAYSAGPNRPEDSVLDLQARLTFEPAGTPLEIQLELNHERQLGVTNTLTSTNVGVRVGATF